jgi:hypothetical protein
MIMSALRASIFAVSAAEGGTPNKEAPASSRGLVVRREAPRCNSPDRQVEVIVT